MARIAEEQEIDEEELAWVPAGEGYAVALAGADLAFRNPKGKRLQAVPKTLRESETAAGLERLAAWLPVHQAECTAAVERWMLLGLAIPRATVEALWRDSAWQAPMHGALVRLGAGGDPDFRASSRLGFFHSADARLGISVIDADGELVSFEAAAITLLHPLAIESLERWRRLAATLTSERALMPQGISQLARTVHLRPDGKSGNALEMTDFAEGLFVKRRDILERCRLMGFEVVAGDAVIAVREDGRLVEARYQLGEGKDDERTLTGALRWVDARGRVLRRDQVGAIAYSEGVRMAESIWSGRVVRKRGRA